jgi:nucleoside 2-deoxyribosyltransferase
MDIGTGFEMGYDIGYEAGFNAAVNKFLKFIPKPSLVFANKPVVGYREGILDDYKTKVEPDGWGTEDFEIPDNLMVWMSPSRIVESFERAVTVMVEILNA